MPDNIQKPKLTGKQTAFIQHYLGDCKYNGTQAAIKAGYSPKTAHEQAKENLNKPYIKLVIDQTLAEIKQKNEVTIEEIIENARWLIKYGRENGKMAAMIAGNDQLGRTIAAFTDKVENLGDGLTINVKGRESGDKEVEKPVLKLHTGTDNE